MKKSDRERLRKIRRENNRFGHFWNSRLRRLDIRRLIMPSGAIDLRSAPVAQLPTPATPLGILSKILDANRLLWSV
ncbi:MAG: hypothetical protein U1F65_05820 [Verrucomicrobiota bacterium]